jgi:5-methylcytosine-specific restriction endonuclease McrA
MSSSRALLVDMTTSELLSVRPVRPGRGPIKRCANCEIDYRGRGKTCGDPECVVTHKRAVRAVWAEANREDRAAKQKAWYQANAEERRAKMRAYYQETQLAQVESSRRWRAENREKHRTDALRWQRDNPDRVAARASRRRAVEVAAPGDGVPSEDWLIILELSDRRCSYCTCELTEETGTHMEHVVPLSRGGWHDSSNVVPACETCNLTKHTKTAAEWLPDWVPPSWIILREESA